MDEQFIRDLDIIRSGDRPLSLAMNPTWPYGEKEMLIFNKLMSYMDKGGPTEDQFNKLLLQYEQYSKNT